MLVDSHLSSTLQMDEVMLKVVEGRDLMKLNHVFFFLNIVIIGESG